MEFDKIISDENLKLLKVDMFQDYPLATRNDEQQKEWLQAKKDLLAGKITKEQLDALSEKQMSEIYPSLTEEERCANVAFFARAMKEHVGWDVFPEEAKQNFTCAIEEIYSDSQPKTARDLMLSLGTAVRLLPDKHASVSLFNGMSVKSGCQSNAGKNVLSAGRDDIEFFDKKEGIWGIGQTKDGSALVVSIASCFREDGNRKENWDDFKAAFEKAYEKNYSRIILDVRGNMGGEDWPLDYIARRTYGNDLNAMQTAEVKDTKLGMHFLSKHGMFRNEEKPFDIENMPVSGDKRVLMDERDVYYLFNVNKGYLGQIDVLMDGAVSSAAESAHTLFYHHPNARFVGEPTNGMQQYQQGNVILPCGLSMRVGVLQRNYYDGMIEGIGHDVDIHVPLDENGKGADAFDVALTNDDMSKTRERQESLQDLYFGRLLVAKTLDYMERGQRSFSADCVKAALKKMHSQIPTPAILQQQEVEAPAILKQENNSSSLRSSLAQLKGRS